MHNREPLISFVTHGRNDGYMGDFLWRLSTCLNKIADGVAAIGRLADVEIVVGDWGSPLEPLKKVLKLNEHAQAITRFCTVTKESADRLNRDGIYSYPSAANVPIRRARGKFVFSMDSDAYMPAETARFLLRIAEGHGPESVDLDRSFFWLSRLHIPFGFLTESRTCAELDQFIHEQPEKLIRTAKCNLEEFRGGAVAIFAKRELFESIRGYNESLVYWGWADVDIHHRLTFNYKPLDLWDFGGLMYHLEHYPQRGKPVGDRKLNPQEIPIKAVVNGEDWGAFNESVVVSMAGKQDLEIAPTGRVRNFIISGTNYWNPGDDFVRDGVIHVLHALFPGELLNFHFYNFNEDQFPKTKFKGIGNEVSAGDLELCRDFIDGVIVAGLSAGHEIKDLYRWVIANRLEDRVYLIGAGYENPYCAENMVHEPEATIFRKARIITGRTAKHPAFMDQTGTPYVHLNCPALLSVKQVKSVPAGKKIKRIGFSIQLPHDVGIPNQSTGAEVSKLAIETLFDLAKTHAVEVIAHHKSEYFYFLHLLKDTGIPVIYSSFYQDLHEVYPRYDLVVTTRLHSSLFANGHGIPGIIINDTDRHTHTLQGFPHSVWVNSRSAFDEAFARVLGMDLAKIPVEAECFKNALTDKYVITLKPYFCGLSDESKTPPAKTLPVHFFTIVLNGLPFIRHHIEQLKTLPFNWHWHIVEGVAELNHDTGWSKEHGGRIPADQHRNGLSIDGTTGYLDELKKQFPENITLHRPPAGRFWDGKREMVNAPLAGVPDDSLLWQVDADELWTATQIIRARSLFLAHPEKTAAYFWCHYFVGSDRVITSRDTYGNHSDFEWLRVWRFRTGDQWMAHEPPRLGRCLNGLPPVDVGSLDPILHPDTEAMGLVFQHFAYATEAQARFKRDYYGYPHAVSGWKSLQQASVPCRLGEHFDWVHDQAVVDHMSKLGLESLAQKEWFSGPKTVGNPGLGGVERILFVRTDSIGDNILASSMLAPIKAAHPQAKIAVLCQAHVTELYVASPFVDSVICYERASVETEAGQREIVDEIAAFRPDVILNSVRSRDVISEILTLGFRKTRHIAIESDLCNLTADNKADADKLYSQLVPALTGAVSELEQHRVFLGGIGIETRRLVPAVWTSAADEVVAEEFFAVNGLDPLKTIALFPFTQHEIKDYPFLSESLVELAGWNFIILGGAESRDHCEVFGRTLRGNVYNVAGMTTLRQMAALIRRCRIVVGADSCAPHMACALGVPNVVVLGGGHFGRFMPYSPLTAAVSLPMDCYGCNWQCRHACAHCVKDIPAALVAEAIRVTLKGVSSVPRIFVPAETVQGEAGAARIRQMETLLGGTEVELCPVGDDDSAVQTETDSMPEGLGVYLAQLEKALAAQDMVTAEKVLRKAHAEFPANAELATALANLQFQCGHFEDAVPTFKTVCALKPNDPVLPVLLAHCCMNSEDAEGVEAAIQLAFKVQPGNPHAVRFMADMNVKLGRHREAAHGYGQLIQGGSTDAEVLLALGVCFQKIGDKNGAVACFTEVIRQQPAHTEANRRLAELSPKPAVSSQSALQTQSQMDHEKVGCPKCGSRDARVVRNRADIVQCGACQIVYLRTRLTKDAMRKLYQSYADGGSHMALPKTIEEADKSGLSRDYFLKEILEFVEPKGGFLDVGCGWGGFLHNARKKGFEPRGIELTRKCVGYANETLGIPVVDTQLEETGLPAGSLSVVSMNHVLEHLPEPKKALKKVIDSLRPGGMYCGMVPNFDSACSSAQTENWYWLDPFYHYTHFTPATLRRTLEEAGFVVERIYTATGDYGAENVRKACLPVDPKLADNDYFAAEIKRYETEGRGEEIRFFARKPTTTVPADQDSANASEYLLIDSPGMPQDSVVSVVVSTYQSEKLIRACLTNLTRQTIFDRCEVIVVDSGSPENERAIVEEFQAKHPNIRYLRTHRETLYAAWNRGLELARGKFWVNANTDDALRDDALDVLVAAMEKHQDCALAYGDTAWTSVPNDTFPSKNILQTVKYGPYAPADTLFYCVTGCLQFWRSETLRQLGGFDATLKFAGDYEATLKLMRAGLNAVHVPEVLSLFFQNTGGLTQSSKGADEEHEQVMNSARQALDIGRVFRVLQGDANSLANAWSALGLKAAEYRVPWEKAAFVHGDFAAECFRKGLEAAPNNDIAGRNYVRMLETGGSLATVEERLRARFSKAADWIFRIRGGEGLNWSVASHAVSGRTYRPAEWVHRPTAEQLGSEPAALRPWITRIDGRHVYLSEDLFPAPAGSRYTPEEHEGIAMRLAGLLRELPDFYAHFGGAGDALLLLASFYDQKPGATVFSYPNSVGATKALFDGFPKLGRIYFLPAHADAYFHIVLRYAIRVLKNCLGAGATPREGYEEEWKAGLDITRRYGINKSPKWAAAMRKNSGSKRVALAPMGSMAGMVGSKRNIIDPAVWPDVVAHVIDRGFEPVIFGLPPEAKDYPALVGCVDARGKSFAEQMSLIGECAGLVGADSWGKTFSGLAGIPTLVFEPLKGPDLLGWKDPADWVFIEPWPSIRMVSSLEAFRAAFDAHIAGRHDAAAASKPKRPVVAWEGSFLDYGSLSHINRELSRHLADDGSVRLTCVSSQPMAAGAAEDPAMKKLARNVSVHAPEGVALTIRHQWPPNWSPVSEGKLVVIQPWEYGALPQEWVAQAGNVDEFWVPSRIVRSMYVTSGIPPQKVRVLPNGVDIRKFRPGAQPLALPTRKKFKFLFVGGTIHRKGPDILLNAYLNAFKATDDVCLVIKDFGGGSVYRGQTAADMIAAARKQPNAPEILHLTEELPADKMPSLYAACDCLVHPYRGEGFGMPVLEAMACGLPVVVTQGGSTADFVSLDAGWFIPAREQRLGRKVGDIPLVGDCVLLEPSMPHLASILREIAGKPHEVRAKGAAGRGIVERRFDWSDIAALASFYVKDLLSRATEANVLRTAAPSPGKMPAMAAAKTAPKPFVLPKAALVGHIGEARELLQSKKHRAAWDSASAAIAARPFHPEGWLLLGQIALEAGDSKLAGRCTDRVKALTPQWKPGKELAKTIQKRSSKKTLDWPLPAVSEKPRLTVCLIAKNEERFLGQCLASVKDLADEVVVVDTGSTDKTVEIAKSFGAKTGHFEWCDDFSAARNAALELATGDWILVLDADEELMSQHVAAIHEEMSEAGTMAWRLPLINAGKEADGVSFVPRLFRNAPALFYVGRVHEQVFTSIVVRCGEWGLENKLGRTRLLHHGYTEEMTRDRNKIERNLKLLERAIEEIPGDANLTFNHGLELVRSGKIDAGLARYSEASEILGGQSTEEIVPELREVILTQWMAILKDADRLDELLAVRRQPLFSKGTATASMHYMLGFAALRTGDAELAVHELRACLAVRDTPGLTPIHRDLQTCAPEHCLALALVRSKEAAAARDAFGAALERSPAARPVVLDLARFEAGEGDYGRALTLLYELVQTAPDDVGVWRLGAAIALNRPEVLEVALDWTQSALASHPDDAELRGRRAEALLLAGRCDEARPFFELLVADASGVHLAGALICRLVAGEMIGPAVAGGPDLTQAFLQWYRRLVDWNASAVVQGLNARMADIEKNLPAAARILQAVLADAGV
jgi:glycosyltransferase involved in cell wall biosynthesis/ADP-heptose:LPS heptosyltransferase/tetratricopeptide (TPR) repeat protein